MTDKFRHLAVVHFDRFAISHGIVLFCSGTLGILVYFDLGRFYWVAPIALLIGLVPLMIFVSWFRACHCGMFLEGADPEPVFLKMHVDQVMKASVYLLCFILICSRLSDARWAALFGEIVFCVCGLAFIFSGAFGGAKRVSQDIRFLLSDNLELLEHSDCKRLANLAQDIGETRKAYRLTSINTQELP